MRSFFRSMPGRVIIILAAAALILAAQQLVIRRIVSDPDITPDQQYNMLLGIVLLFLPLAAFALVWALRYWKYNEKPWAVILAAYGLPLVATLITYIWLRSQHSAMVAGRLVESFFRATWQPLFIFWYALVLFFALWCLFPPLLAQRRLQAADVSYGILAGLGCGVISAFLIGIFVTLTGRQGISVIPPQPPALLRYALLLVSFTILPYCTERFFRGILLQRWLKRMPFWTALVLNAALFAILQLRPIVLLPALISALVYAYLQETRHWLSPVLAHAVTNLVLFLLGWQLVF